MKKVIFILTAALTLTVTYSCKYKENEEVKSTPIHKSGGPESEAAKASYECPMDCEKGKIYDEQGKCPVCNMDLIASEALHDAQERDQDALKDGHKDHDNQSH